MWLLCLLAVLILLGGIFLYKKVDYYSSWNMVALLISVFAALAVIILPLVWTVSYNTDKANISIYHATKTSIEEARSQNISEIERAALTTKIIEVNEILASKKYWNNTIFGDMIPNELAELDYLK